MKATKPCKTQKPRSISSTGIYWQHKKKNAGTYLIHLHRQETSTCRSPWDPTEQNINSQWTAVTRKGGGGSEEEIYIVFSHISNSEYI